MFIAGYKRQKRVQDLFLLEESLLHRQKGGSLFIDYCYFNFQDKEIVKFNFRDCGAIA